MAAAAPAAPDRAVPRLWGPAETAALLAAQANGLFVLTVVAAGLQGFPRTYLPIAASTWAAAAAFSTAAACLMLHPAGRVAA
jgi:hypothetical protein